MNTERITQKYLTTFPGDFSRNPMQRQTPKVLFTTVNPVGFENPELIAFNTELSQQIGLGEYQESDLDFLVANNLPENIQPYATAYAGHQFGNWAGQLGDGRAIFAGEITDSSGKTTEIQWKGAGATPYSRHADGRAVLRSSVREFLMSEAMHHLGIPTTRALSLAFTGENVVRDMMYDGNPKYEKGAVVIRTAPSFLRIGHFELLSAQKETETLRKLADFTIENYFPEIDLADENKYLLFFRKVADLTSDLMVHWLRVGFVHGVMNTDNMSVLGLSIDYGPFSFLDEYSLNFTPNTTDLPGRRYAFGQQPKIAQWNLWQFANALFPLIKDEKKLEESLNLFGTKFWEAHDQMMASKMGFDAVIEGDDEIFTGLQSLMESLEIDYTLFFQKLETWNITSDVRNHFSDVFYSVVSDEKVAALYKFLQDYEIRLQKISISREESLSLMRKNNPKFILRNYLLFECIQELDEGKKDLFFKLWDALKNPYEERYPEFTVKRPSKYNGTPGCSTLSCSS